MGFWRNVSSNHIQPTKWLPSVSKLKEKSPWTELTDDENQVYARRVIEGKSEVFYFTGNEKLRDRYKLCTDTL